MTLTLTTLRATIAAALLLAAPAQGLVQSGHAVGAPDGDTANVSIEGAAPRHVRITGIQAMEGRECHGAAATARLNRLIDTAHGRVRLTAMRASSYSLGRPRRAIAGRIGGRWVDFGRVLVREGYVLWDANPVEDEWNAVYSRLVQRAALRHRRLWDPSACGAGPARGARIRVFAQWDAEGDDQANRNGEYVRVENRGGGGTIHLGGWWLRDSALRRYTFPRGARIRPGHSVTLHIGGGRHTGSSYYWGLTRSVFENFDNPHSTARAMGDGAYLFDPQGDLRGSMMYPCRYACVNPLRARVRMTVRNDRSDEAVLIRNVSTRPADLDGQVVKTSTSRIYDLGAHNVSSVVRPGETLRVTIGGDASEDSRLDRHWEQAPPIIDDRSGVVVLRTLQNLLTACYAERGASCPGS